MHRLTVLADVNAHSGYGQHLMEIVRGLEYHGVYCSIRAKTINTATRIPGDIMARIVQCAQPEEWELILSHPYEMPTPGKKTIYYTMWESDRLPPRSVQLLNLADAVIVPCEWNVQVFKESGVKVPIYVVPLGINPSFFKPAPMPKGPTTFGIAGRTANGRIRKGLDEAVYCFQETFYNEPNVRLRIKLHPGDEVDIPKADPRIDVIREHFTDEQLAQWLHSLHVFVSATKGEAWGLWQQQAMACGRPVIAVLHGGLIEFMMPANSLPCLKFFIEPAQDEYLKDSNWCQPFLGSICEMMMLAHTRHYDIAHIGHRAAQDAREFTWGESIRKLKLALHDIGVFGGEMIAPRETQHFTAIDSSPFGDRVLARKEFDPVKVEFPVKDNRLRFNPSIIGNWMPSLMAVRSAVFHNGDRIDNRIEIWTMDEDAPKDCKVLHFEDGFDYEDPRLLMHKTRLFMSVTRWKQGLPASQRLIMLTDDLEVDQFWDVPFGMNGKGPEKNWIWFSEDSAYGPLRFIYTVSPHVVVTPGFDAEGAVEINDVEQTGDRLKWKWGQPRGGTVPVRFNEHEFLCFFHSALPWKQRRRRYYMGAYAFEARSPWRITRMSAQPILEGTPNHPSMIIPHSVVFPCGAYLSGDDVFKVSIGVNDDSCVLLTVNLEQLNLWPLHNHQPVHAKLLG